MLFSAAYRSGAIKTIVYYTTKISIVYVAY